MKKQLSLTILGLLLVSMIAFLPNIANTAHGYTPADYKASIIRAADRLVALQSVPPGPPTPADYGWDWVVTGLTSHSASPSATNLYGVTAQGLIDAYELTGNASYLTAAENSGNFMKYGNPSAGDFYNGHDGYYWGYSSDYRFLMTLSTVSGNVIYANYALAAWAWQKANRSQDYGDGNQSILWSDYADGWVGTGMYGAGAWGTSDWVLATLQMGDTVWAQHMAATIHANMTNLLSANVSTDYKDMGMGSALQCLATLDPVTYASDITSLKAALVADQLPDGSWGYGSLPGDPQTTAYVVMGLWTAGEYTLASQGADWLVANQLPNGGWTIPGYDEYSEPDSEGMQALYATRVHDVAVTSVVAVVPHCSSKVGNDLWVFQGRPVYVNATVLNKGDFDENVTVTLYYNITAYQMIGAQDVTLPPGQNGTLSFVWDTTSVPYCHNYTITAVATIPLDNNPADNTLDNVYVKVRILGDLNGDGKVSGSDIALAAWSFGSYGPNCLFPGSPASPRWNLDADINGNNKIDGTDIAKITRNFGKSCSP